VREISALFIYDRARKIWFAGTDRCLAKLPRGLAEKYRGGSVSSANLLATQSRDFDSRTSSRDIKFELTAGGDSMFSQPFVRRKLDKNQTVMMHELADIRFSKTPLKTINEPTSATRLKPVKIVHSRLKCPGDYCQYIISEDLLSMKELVTDEDYIRRVIELFPQISKIKIHRTSHYTG
jgi:hypothetical protein